MKIPGYRIKERIYSGQKSLVYRGLRENDQIPVVIKLMRNEYPSFSDIAQFRNQYSISKTLDVPGIIKTYSLEKYRNGYVLVMEDFGGISLEQGIKTWETDKTRSNPEFISYFLEIALQIVSILDLIHQNRIIHKDIKPANILVKPSTGEVKIIDFSIASLLPKEVQALTNPNILEGTLAYISPEQTGRMNRGIDYRSDFYSLGITFFEILTGQLPFNSTEPMELVHCHIAQQPPIVSDINSNVPAILSEIVSKLMAKNAEERYQSSLGLKHDLYLCLQQWQEHGKIAPFELGTQDICDHFVISEKLYGREVEINNLLAAFERVSQGNNEMMLVAGYSGIGKTAVVNEVHKPMVQRRSYFIRGKFDQVQRDVPFSALVQAFGDLITQLLLEPDAQIQAWKENLLQALGEQAQVIVDIIPDLELIIGKQPEVNPLAGNAAQNRFNLLFQKFIQVFATPEHPLVIFLDDLQWADAASLKFIELLMSPHQSNSLNYECQNIGEHQQGLLLIGAYRDNEVSKTHPLYLTLKDIEESGAIINTITLEPLTQSQLNFLIADTLHCSEEIATPLTQLVFAKTKGNPFFATQFLKYLHNDGLIKFNLDVRYWEYELETIKASALTDDVVEFMTAQLKKLPRHTQQVLKLAACIGNKFDLKTLAVVYEKSEVETAADLWEALIEGLVVSANESYKLNQYKLIFSQRKQKINL